MLDSAQVLAVLTLVLSAVAIVLLGLLVRTRMRAERLAERSADLADGMVILAADSRITDLSHEARLIPGAEPGARLEEVLSRAIGGGREETLAALQNLMQSGRQMHLLVRSQDGKPWELIGKPAGGEVRIVLRDASMMIAQMEKVQSRISARERALAAGWYEREIISNLLESGTAIAWFRTADGSVAWSAGHVRSSEGVVSAEQAVALITARPDGGQAPGAPAERSRIEILPPGCIEPLPLQVIEMHDTDGTRRGFASDASMAASAERTLSRFVQTMTETFAHLTVGLAIFDRNQTLALFNPALAQMLQLEPAWLARRPSLRDVIDALRSSRRIPETGDFHAWRQRLTDLFDNTETADYEELWNLADGANINVLARPHPHGSLAFVFDDVSERMRLEQNYRQSIDLRRATLNRLDEGLAVFGTDGMLQFVNDAFHEIWGTEREGIGHAMHARELIRLCEGQTIETDVWQRMIGFITADETRTAWSARLTMGSSRTLSARIAPLPGGATMAVFADITDSERIAQALRERNAALEAAEEMRTAVLDQISHRLRTPLNNIFGFGQLLSDPRFGTLSEHQREYANGILEASGQLLDTIDDVTELASLQLDPLHDESGEPVLAETLELVRQILDKRATDASVGLGVELPDEAVRLSCDSVNLRQIVFNMIAGAIQRSPAGARVTVDAEELPQGRVAIRVRELREPGMPAFGPEGEGDQLALGVLGRMVEQEGGSISREDTGPETERLTVCILDQASGTAPSASADGDRAAAAAAAAESGALDAALRH